MYRKISLSPREQEIIELMRGNPNLKEISELLGISYRTLQWHLTKVYGKFGVKNRIELLLELITMTPDFLIR